MAPELFTWNDHDANHLPIRTKESDVYAFARTVEEVRYYLKHPALLRSLTIVFLDIIFTEPVCSYWCSEPNSDGNQT
jgi:hypothetical protein